VPLQLCAGGELPAQSGRVAPTIDPAAQQEQQVHAGRNLFITRLVGLTPAAVTGGTQTSWRHNMNGLIYLIGLIVVVMAVLSLLGLH
jgi:hypothetical protein